ncbi:ABC transporter ATP-binding protein [Paenisporosarcina indica]|uniref:ABC transporter ATP-binding protein n=1 Tax=Paenisporosarcina indica TaxID=650093 RepID=UPI000A03AD98|nr:ABC transporter ATP-binding protein [Paenisporosarcina indica]
MIQTKDLTMEYPNGFTAVNQLSLQVNEGDIYGFLGPNGAGKTTTIRMLDGLLKPTAGEVLIQGKSVIRNEREIRKMIGVLPESHGYYNWMTGAEYLLFFAQLYGVSKSKQKERVEEVLRLVGMTSKANIPIGQYSRGMRQRIGIAKTIIHEPLLIFLDEPTLGLDPQGQRDIQMILHDLNKKHGVTIFITSHLLKEISEICNRVAIVKEGNLIEEDYLESLLNKYGSLKVDTTVPITLEEVFFYLTNQEDKEMNL